MDRLELSVCEAELPLGGLQPCVDIRVNGGRLLEVIRDAEVPHVVNGAGEYAGLHATIDAIPGRARPTFLAIPPVDEARLQLFRCTCGDIGCSYVTALVRWLPDEVVWSAFSSSNVPAASALEAVGPYHFDRTHYEAELRGLARRER